MNVLMVGAGKGSWEMRGVQLGAAIGARVTTAPTETDWRWADVAVLIKKHAQTFAPDAHRFHVPIVWDALDFWQQPRDNQASPALASDLLQAQIAAISPALVIGATEAMASACGGVYLPHHSWAGLVPTPPRERVSVVAYDGNPIYLGAWHQALQSACAARGWSFIVNPPDLSQADVLVAFRDGPWDGWICREWKSGVKVGNAIAAGRPLIGQASAAVRELCPPGSIVESVKDLEVAFDTWTPLAARAVAVETCQGLAPTASLSVVAARYRELLQTVESRCAA